MGLVGRPLASSPPPPPVRVQHSRPPHPPKSWNTPGVRESGDPRQCPRHLCAGTPRVYREIVGQYRDARVHTHTRVSPYAAWVRVNPRRRLPATRRPPGGSGLAAGGTMPPPGSASPRALPGSEVSYLPVPGVSIPIPGAVAVEQVAGPAPLPGAGAQSGAGSFPALRPREPGRRAGGLPVKPVPPHRTRYRLPLASQRGSRRG